MEVLTWVANNWDTILTGIVGVIGGFSILAKLTPTKTDDVIIDKILAFIQAVALNPKKGEARK